MLVNYDLIARQSSGPSMIKSYLKLSNSLANFGHFDVQSTFFNYDYVKLLMNNLHTTVNIKTGASAATASRQSSMESMSIKTMCATPNQTLGNKFMSNRFINHSGSTSTATTSPTIVDTSTNTSKNQNGSNNAFGLFNDSVLSSTNHQNHHNNQFSNDLVEDCPCFRVEIGGDTFRGLGLVHETSQRRMMKLNSVNILDKINSNYKKELIDLIEANNNESFTIEYQDWGSYFYRYFISCEDHANYLGIDANLGPLAISIRRELLINEPLPARSNSSNANCVYKPGQAGDKTHDFAYRFILRTSDVRYFKNYC
jgi:hypothetical protein